MRRLLSFGILIVAAASGAVAERLVLAWPPTLYESAELCVHRGPATPSGPAPVTISARGLSFEGDVPELGALRVALPAEARCGEGVEACAIFVESSTTGLRVVLQSPDTNGVPDTLARTAHDTVRAPSAGEAGRLHVVLSAPNSPDFASAASFASVVPVAGPATVRVTGGCAVQSDLLLLEGEVLTLACRGAGEDLSGALVESDAPVVVFSGNVVAPMPVVAGSGWSADLLLDAPPALDGLVEGSTWLVPPLPRAASHHGLGDLVRCAAARDSSLRVRDDRGRDETLHVTAGEPIDLDTADAGGDLVLRLDAEGPLACWHLTKSRAHRGSGDPAAVPLTPLEHFVTQDRAFVPDGYGERTDLVVVAVEGAAVSLDGSLLGGFAPGPGGELSWTVVPLARPPVGEGLILHLEADAPFGAWLLGQGGYKAHGLAAAGGVPAAAPAPELVLRGSSAERLTSVAEVFEPRWRDEEGARPLWYYRVEASALLSVSACGGAACLDWSVPGGG